jgi:hypothetical protein
MLTMILLCCVGIFILLREFKEHHSGSTDSKSLPEPMTRKELERALRKLAGKEDDD